MDPNDTSTVSVTEIPEATDPKEVLLKEQNGEKESELSPETTSSVIEANPQVQPTPTVSEKQDILPPPAVNPLLHFTRQLGAGWNWTLILCVVVINIGALLYGYQATMLNSIHEVIVNCPNITLSSGHPFIPDGQNFFQPCIPMTDFEWSMVVSIIYIGGLFGNFVPDVAVRYVSPLTIIWWGTIPSLVGTIFMSLFSNVYLFILARFLMGVSGGVWWNIGPIYLSDIAPATLRGTIGVSPTLSQFLCMLYAQVLGIFLGFHPGWRILVGMSFILGLLQLILIPFVQNSPRWLIKRQYSEQAIQSLEKLRHGKVHEEFSRIEKEMIKSEKGIKKISFQKRLCYPKVVKNLALISFIYGIAPFTGANIVSQYSTDIFNSVGFTEATTATALVGVCTILAVTVSLFVVDKFGRRKILIGGLIGQSISFGTLALAYVLTKYVSWAAWFSLIGVFGYILSNAFALGPLVPLLVTELFPQDLEQFAVTTTTTIDWGSCALATFLFPLMSAVMGDYVFVPLFICNVICLVVIIFFLPETKSKSLEELQASFGYHQDTTTGEKEFNELLISLDAKMVAEFEAFLSREGDIDNWTFIRDLDEFKKAPEEKREVIAFEIYMKYFESHSDHQLTFTLTVVEGIVDMLKDTDWTKVQSTEIYDAAAKEIQETQLLSSFIRMKNKLL
jgi:sugar porter (SP) family MFS transporter